MSKKKILVIDDEEDFCYLMKLNLEGTGDFEVITAFSGQEGIDKSKQMAFDLVIMDLNMPDLSGEEALDTLKQMNPSLPVLLFSVYHDDISTLSSAVKSKADGIIAKPIDHSQLYATINNVLNKSKPR
ncbi:MAG: response regulator [Candidatus Omnitrophica bacterium]|nr:response regulator [Candidatus Omnitrophota bacterium]